MTQVIVNLLDNAISFSNPESEIVVEVAVSENNIITRITDHGPGINEDIKDKIFRRFFTTKKKTSSTGIGLSIAKMIIEKHKGMVTFKDNTPQGTVFELFMPLD